VAHVCEQVRGDGGNGAGRRADHDFAPARAVLVVAVVEGDGRLSVDADRRAINEDGAKDLEVGLPGEDLGALLDRCENHGLAPNAEVDAGKKGRPFAGEVGLEFGRRKLAVAIGVDALLHPEGRDLGEVEDVVEADRFAIELDAGVLVHGEVAERVSGGFAGVREGDGGGSRDEDDEQPAADVAGAGAGHRVPPVARTRRDDRPWGTGKGAFRCAGRRPAAAFATSREPTRPS
jgi:hypothetical protein